MRPNICWPNVELDISGLLSEEGFMGKLGKETKTLLIAITAVCLISFLLAGGIATLLAKNFQQELLLHDYGVAGHLLNNENELSISAFTSQPDANDIERGREALRCV